MNNQNYNKYLPTILFEDLKKNIFLGAVIQ